MDIFNRIKNMKIMLVDDDEWIRDSLALFFEAEGCNLLTFETAEEGMEAVKQQAYDIVISDYKFDFGFISFYSLPIDLALKMGNIHTMNILFGLLRRFGARIDLIAPH